MYQERNANHMAPLYQKEPDHKSIFFFCDLSELTKQPIHKMR